MFVNEKKILDRVWQYISSRRYEQYNMLICIRLLHLCLISLRAYIMALTQQLTNIFTSIECLYFDVVGPITHQAMKTNYHTVSIATHRQKLCNKNFNILKQSLYYIYFSISKDIYIYSEVYVHVLKTFEKYSTSYNVPRMKLIYMIYMNYCI